MSLCVFAISFNEAALMPFFLRHYATIADKIIVFDEQSTDGTREIVQACPKAELREWPWKGLDDERFREAVNEWYLEARGNYDWVAWPDIDELLWHPNLAKLLDETKADMLGAYGYAMVTREKLQKFSGQIYDRHRLGVRQPNYDKFLIWRAKADILHAHGRHSYLPEFPRCSGRRIAIPELKLLHYRYFGIDETKMRNERNYARALEKRFAWNYDQKHNDDPEQSGSLAWTSRVLLEGVMQDALQANPLEVIPLWR